MTERINTAKWLKTQNRWQIKVQKNGIRRSFSSSTPGRAGQLEANAKADAWLSEEKDYTARRSVTVYEAAQEWMDGLKLRTSREHWRKADERTRKYFLPIYGHYLLRNLTEADIQKTIDRAYKTANLSHKTLSNLRADLSNFLKYCRKAQYTTLRIEDVDIAKTAARSSKSILAPDNIAKVFQCRKTLYKGKEVDDVLLYAYRLAIVTGLRPGELLALQKKNVTGSSIKVSGSINDKGEMTTGKNENAIRTIAKTPLAADIIDAQLALLEKRRDKSPFLFPGEDGAPVRQKAYRLAWYRFCDHNGIDKVTPYELRHTFVSVNKLMPDGLKKMVVGHSKDMDTEGVYGHEMDGDREAAAEYIQAAFERIITPKK